MCKNGKDELSKNEMLNIMSAIHKNNIKELKDFILRRLSNKT